MKKFILLLATVFFILNIYAQDTLTVVAYNLLNYGNYTSYCTTDNNNMATKTDYIKTIISYTKPDIFGASEIASDQDVTDYLLNNAFILNGFNNYKYSQIIHDQYSPISPQIFYNANKLGEKTYFVVSAYPRSIVIHKMYLKTKDLAQGDTIFIYVIVAHLKAGTTSEDSVDRANATANLMAYIQDHDIRNYILMGDFNTYSAYEGAYQNLVNPSNPDYKFYDPAPAGDWHNNPNYAYYQTQSTNYYSDGCKAGGGLDDRFDFIMYSKPVTDQSLGILALTSTFKVIGQDGKHFNDAVDYNGNNSVPANVLSALKNNSDHLPVLMKFLVKGTFAKLKTISSVPALFKVSNTIDNNLLITVNNNQILLKANSISYAISTITGQKIYSGQIPLSPNQIHYRINYNNNLTPGIYIITLKAGNYLGAYKFVKF